ncbi:MAG TPA: glycosyltransferase family 39 protein [Bacteroidota bacterium]|nr:glycosyltransferase family 39 protein [Bacteroidota bacterium]
MKIPFISRGSLDRGTQLLLLFAGIKLAIHFYTNAFAGYGIFRDELYYVACSDHLSAGYVDQPPLSIFLLALNRLFLGSSIFALRFLPAVAGAATVFLTGLMARELGGGRFAQAVAALASIVSLIFLGYDAIFSMNAFDVLCWAWCAYVLILLVKTGDKKYWLYLGFLLGLGLLNKIDVLWLGFGILVGVALTSERRWLKTEYPYIAGFIAFAFFLPYIIWNATHAGAHLEFIHNASGVKYSSLTPRIFLIGQLLLQNPVTIPLWLSGLVVFLFSKTERRYRLLAFVYLTTIAILLINGHSKPEYSASAYSMLFAGGAVGIERWTSHKFLRWLKPLYFAVVASGIVLAPLVLPILPVETYIRFADALGVAPTTPEGKKLDKLPQFYADMFGWEDKAAAVARIFHSLSPDDQKKCAIFADNYGRCGAIDFYSEKYNLPKSIGPHNNYWIWGPRDYTGELVLVLGGDLKGKTDRFESVTIADTVRSKYAMPYENNLPIYICRHLKVPLKQVWPSLKHFE